MRSCPEDMITARTSHCMPSQKYFTLYTEFMTFVVITRRVLWFSSLVAFAYTFTIHLEMSICYVCFVVLLWWGVWLNKGDVIIVMISDPWPYHYLTLFRLNTYLYTNAWIRYRTMRSIYLDVVMILWSMIYFFSNNSFSDIRKTVQL